MIFEVIQSLSISINGQQSNLKTNFEIDFEIQEKTNSERIYIIKKEKATNVDDNENSHLIILEQLEWLTYPLKIATNLDGAFLRILDFNKWLMSWEQNAQLLLDEYDNLENLKDIRDKYYEIVKDEQIFTANKFKEPFWNLIFFSPPIDNVNKPDLGTTLNWNIKSIGILPCVGRTTIQNPASEEVIIYFESEQKITNNIVEIMQSKLQDVKWEEQKINLQVIANFDTTKRKLKNKKALFKFTIGNAFSYTEETNLVLKKN